MIRRPVNEIIFAKMSRREINDIVTAHRIIGIEHNLTSHGVGSSLKQ